MSRQNQRILFFSCLQESSLEAVMRIFPSCQADGWPNLTPEEQSENHWQSVTFEEQV